MSERNSLVKSGDILPNEQETHPLITLSILTIGTKIGAEFILKLARHPALLFGMGLGAGFYINKNRKEIIAAAQQLKRQGIAVINKKADN